MKKTLLIFLSLTSLLAFTMSSCQKETVVTTTFEATMEECEDDDGKVAFTNGTMQWVTGDQIKVFGAAGSGVYQATVRSTGRATFHCVEGDAGEAPYRAVYPASAANDDGTVELPVVQVTEDGSLTGFPMYAQGSSTNLNFKNLCGVLRMRLQKSGVSITAIEVTGDIELTGDYNVVYSSGVPTLEYSGHGMKTTMMTCNTPQSIANQKDFYIFLPVHTFSEGMRIRIYSSDGGVCTKTVSAGNSVRIQRSKITTITLRNNSLTFAPDAGALPGLFTINENGDQVRFSQGNLQYTTLGTHAGALGSNMPGTWRFAPEQYEYVGEGNANISDTYPKWIDLFGYGTGNNPTLHSDNENDYQTFVDWGANVIVNGGNTTFLWKTLTIDEWDYLFRSRADAIVKYGIGNVNGVHGLIILPDNWTLPSGCTFTSGLASQDDWTLNSYTFVQWADMEAAGAVFLPASGQRGNWGDICWVSNFGEIGYSRSSTIHEFIEFAYYLAFDSYNLNTNESDFRSCGLSVRLVWNN